MTATCETDSCDRPIFSRQWCQKHYTRWLRHGDPSHTHTPGRDTGRRDRGGAYVYVKRPGHPIADSLGWVAEHRFVAWEAGRLTDPADDVHHRNGVKTDNRLENLRPMTKTEHGLEHAVRPTHCVHGHEYTPENSFYRKNGHRECRTCIRERERRRRARRSLKTVTPGA